MVRVRDARLPTRFATPVAGGAIMVPNAFLQTVTNSQEPAWSATVLLGKTKVQFKLDTGAAVMAITDDTYKSLKSVTPKKHSKLLYGPAR